MSCANEFSKAGFVYLLLGLFREKTNTRTASQCLEVQIDLCGEDKSPSFDKETLLLNKEHAVKSNSVDELRRLSAEPPY